MAGDTDKVDASKPPSPNKKTRTSRAQDVVEMASRQRKVHNLPSTRLERGTVDGKPKLTAIFPRKGKGEPYRLDLSFLLDFPGLTEVDPGNWTAR